MNITARAVARAMTALLWLAGSAYLIKAELGSPTPDWVVIAATPLLWATVIGLPVLAHHAFRARNWVAMILMLPAALAGTAYTLTGTIGRQAESHETKALTADAANEGRKLLDGELKRARDSLADAQSSAAKACRKSAYSDNCSAWSHREKAYQARVDQLVIQIGSAKPRKPTAVVEKRIAAAIALLPNVDTPADKLEAAVALILPALLGIFLELAALACAFFGWHPEAQHAPATGQPAAAPQPRRIEHDPIVQLNEDEMAVISALRKAGRPVTNDELAGLMGVSKSEASKRVSACNGHIHRAREGREVRISLN